MVKYPVYKTMSPHFEMEAARTMDRRGPLVITALLENILENNVNKV
jgi:hypothetical protein